MALGPRLTLTLRKGLGTLLTFLVLVLIQIPDFEAQGTSSREVEILSKKYGESLNRFSNAVTKYAELRDSFSKMGTAIEEVNIQSLFSKISGKMNDSLHRKIEAIQKIVVYAEPLAKVYYDTYPPEPKKSHKDRDRDKPLQPRPEPKSYYSAKRLVPPSPEVHVEKKEPEEREDDGEDDEEKENNRWKFPTEMLLTQNEHFQNNVNMSHSSVHVPTSIYEMDPALVDALVWSSDLEPTFKSNYENNPTLGWQYFGSSTGFLRVYPAIKWPKDNLVKTNPDLYDARTRPWYTGSATSPKNIVILQDVSGSMTGMRRKIAKEVVSTILDTLTENDYVNVFNFSHETRALVGCFNESGVPKLVQANLANIREFKTALGQRHTEKKAEYEIALNIAFDTLEAQRDESESAGCNQAIMLISDGAPYYFEEVFEKRNKDKRVRIFTYVIGREVTDHLELQWMACSNQGYFAHVRTMSEVQEQVLKYLPVMARPLVMSQNRQVMWTGVYADMAEIVESEWQWEEKIQIEQRNRSIRYKWFYQNVAANNQKKGATVNKTEISNFSDGKRQDDKDKPDKLVLHKVKSFLDYGHTNLSQSKIRAMQAEKEREIRVSYTNQVQGIE